MFNCAPALSPYPLANSFSTISNTLKWTPGLALDLLMNWGSFNGHIRTHFILSWTPTILGLATPWTPTKSEIWRSARRVVPGPLCPSCSQAGPPGRGRGCHLRLREDVGRQGDGWRGSMGLGLRILHFCTDFYFRIFRTMGAVGTIAHTTIATHIHLFDEIAYKKEGVWGTIRPTINMRIWGLKPMRPSLGGHPHDQGISPRIITGEPKSISTWFPPQNKTDTWGYHQAFFGDVGVRKSQSTIISLYPQTPICSKITTEFIRGLFPWMGAFKGLVVPHTTTWISKNCKDLIRKDMNLPSNEYEIGSIANI